MRVCAIGILYSQSKSPGLICFNPFCLIFAAGGKWGTIAVVLVFQKIFSTEKRRVMFRWILSPAARTTHPEPPISMPAV